MLLLLALQGSSLVLQGACPVRQATGLALPPSRAPHRCAPPTMEWDYAAQYAEQQNAQRAARMRRLEAEEAAAAAKESGPAKSKAGFKGGIAAEPEGAPKKLAFDASVTGKWESSDTPDFVPQEGTAEYEKYARLLEVKFDEGVRGSQHDGADVAEQELQRNPEMIIEADPTLVYVPDDEECDSECQLERYGQRDFVLPASGELDAELAMFTSRGEPKTIEVSVKPVAMAYEDYYCGFTADSHPAFYVSQNGFGKMERRNGEPTTVEVTVDPQSAKGELVGTLCFILPDERDFCTFYKITCAAR